MSTRHDQNKPDERPDGGMIDVIEVPPARSNSESEHDELSDGEEKEVLDPESTDNGEEETNVEDEPETDEEHGDAEYSTLEGPPSRFKCAVTGGTLKSVVSTIGAIVDESRIYVHGDGLRMRAIDRANVAMDDIDISAAAFEAYDATPGVIATDLERFADIIKLAGKDDLVQVSLHEETRKLRIHIDGLEFNMACLAPESLRVVPDSPDLDLPAEATVARNALYRGITAADMVSDHVSVRIEGQAGRFLLEAVGDTDEVSFGIDDDDVEFGSIDDAESVFSLDYLKKLVKSTPAGADVTLHLGTEFPLVMAYDLAEGHGWVTWLLAPRIQ